MLNSIRFILVLTAASLIMGCADSLPDGAQSSVQQLSSEEPTPNSPTALEVTPSAFNLFPTQMQSLNPSGGALPYSYKIRSGALTVSAVGVVQAPNANDTSVVEITDAKGAVVTVTVTTTLTFGWSQSGFGACSATCGGGTQIQTVTCKNSLGAVVADSNCATAKPAASKACNTQACPVVQINVAPSSACSGAYCSCHVGGSGYTQNPAAARAICNQLGYQTLVSFTTVNGPIGAVQCGTGGTGCFTNQYAGNLICATVSCQLK